MLHKFLSNIIYIHLCQCFFLFFVSIFHICHFLKYLQKIEEPILIKKKRQSKDQNKKTKRSLDWVSTLNNDYKNISIPDEIIQYNLEKSGCNCNDFRVRTLIGIATKKLIFDICKSTQEYKTHYIKGLDKSKQNIYNKKPKIMEMNYLSKGLNDIGIIVNKPQYYVAKPR
mmetsp:Transcript_73439/g.90144  ORF Transcript_73439/g.90144 Transcript_73439/m.90144 type:complete len:170 (-) Transcript_73439:54-563(-)